MYFKSPSSLSKIGWAFFMPFFLLSSLYASSLELSISSYPSRLNPLLATDSASSTIADWVFNGLLKYDKHGKIIADLAEAFYFEDNVTLIITLKKNITWHDGAPLVQMMSSLPLRPFAHPLSSLPIPVAFEM